MPSTADLILLRELYTEFPVDRLDEGRVVVARIIAHKKFKLRNHLIFNQDFPNDYSLVLASVITPQVSEGNEDIAVLFLSVCKLILGQF